MFAKNTVRFMEGDDKYDFIHNFIDGVGHCGGNRAGIHGCDWRCNIVRLWRRLGICVNSHVDRKTFEEKEMSPVTGAHFFFKMDMKFA